MLYASPSQIQIKDANNNLKFDSSLNMPKLVSTSYTSINVPNIGIKVVVTEIVNGTGAGFAATYTNTTGSVTRPSYSGVSYGRRFAIVYVKSSNSTLGHPTSYTLCNGSTILDIINTAAFSPQARRDSSGTNGARVLHVDIQNGYIIFRIETMFNYRFANSMLYGINGINLFAPNNTTSSAMTSSYSRYINGYYGIALPSSVGDTFNSNRNWELLNTSMTLDFMIKEYAW